MAFHATLLVSLESSWWVGVHKLGLRLFGATVWTIIEPLSQWKLNKIENWKVYWNLGVFLVLSESLWDFIFNRVYFTIFRAKVWKIFIFEWILLLKIQTNRKNLSLEGRIRWALKDVSHCGLKAKEELWKLKKYLKAKEELQKLKKYPKAKEELQKLKKYLRQKKNYGNSKSI